MLFNSVTSAIKLHSQQAEGVEKRRVDVSGAQLHGVWRERERVCVVLSALSFNQSVFVRASQMKSKLHQCLSVYSNGV